jgi:predicted nucleic acid-binding protein
MKYVLDASVAVKWVLPEPESAKALRLRADFLAGVHELLAPDIFSAEVAHALARAERRGLIPVGDATAHLGHILTNPPPFHPYQPLLLRALDIASGARIGVYDCLYVALAEREVCEFVTADVRLVNVLGPRFPFIVSLASLP